MSVNILVLDRSAFHVIGLRSSPSDIKCLEKYVYYYVRDNVETLFGPVHIQYFNDKRNKVYFSIVHEGYTF